MNIRTGLLRDNYNNKTVNDWTIGWAFQAGGGDIDGIGRCFFEAFNECYCVRGEGMDIVTAENMAWDKFTIYKNCNHDFKRLSDNSDIGVCDYCGCKHRNIFDILTKCFKCGVVGASHHTNDSVYCFKHYKESIRCQIDKYVEGIDDSYHYGHVLRTLWIINKTEELNLISETNTDKEISDIIFKVKSGYFEYLMDLCKLNYNKYKSSCNLLHYVDIFEMVERVENIYSGMFEVYLCREKTVVSVNDLSKYETDFIDFIKIKAS